MIAAGDGQPGLPTFQLGVAGVFFALPARKGFLLAGGAALLAQHLTARPTEDLNKLVPHVHWSRPLCREHRRRDRERAWASPAKVQAPGAVQRVTCDPGLARVADTLGDSYWRRGRRVGTLLSREPMTTVLSQRQPSDAGQGRTSRQR